MTNLKVAIEKLIDKQNLDSHLCEKVLDEMLLPETNQLQIAAFLVLLRAKKETAEELFGLVSALKKKMVPVHVNYKVLDIVGTGGDGANTVNISTGSSILAASCGAKVAKHGGRAASSLSGSADVLEALGINIDVTPEKVSACIDEVGIGFCFAPHFHPAMKAVRELRRTLNVPTIFNSLGTLLNPVNSDHLLLGVFDKSLLPLMTKTLNKLGTQHSMIVHSKGLDEISTAGPATVFEINQGEMTESIINPKQYGFSLCTISDLKGGNAKTNAQLLLDVFAGEKNAIADTLILNAAIALYLYGSAPSIAEGVKIASENFYAGNALRLLKRWKEFSHDK